MSGMNHTNPSLTDEAGLLDTPIPIHVSLSKVDRINGFAHKHDYIELIYVYSGKVAFLVEGIMIHAIKGDMIIIPPGITHELTNITISDSVVFTVIFSTDIESFISEKKHPPSIIKFSGMKQIEIENIFNEAQNEQSRKEPGYDIYVKSLLLHLLVIAEREHEKTNEKSNTSKIRTSHKEAIQKAVDYVKENYKQDINIRNIAKIAMLSSSYFSSLFKTVTGTTFIEYLNNLRVQKALTLLTETNLRVLDICYEVGFNNVSHFNKVFRQYMGVNPQYFRGKNLR